MKFDTIRVQVRRARHLPDTECDIAEITAYEGDAHAFCLVHEIEWRRHHSRALLVTGKLDAVASDFLLAGIDQAAEAVRADDVRQYVAERLGKLWGSRRTIRNSIAPRDEQPANPVSENAGDANKAKSSSLEQQPAPAAPTIVGPGL